MGYRIAFAGTGEYIDQHFGSARYFQVYDLADDGTYTAVETREAAASCQGNCEGGFGHLLTVLDDCDAVFVSKIGPGAAAFMIQNGKRVFEASGRMEEIIAHLISGTVLEEPERSHEQNL
jgi:predicted Fe-Mo cluster-binding NifX family protein